MKSGVHELLNFNSTGLARFTSVALSEPVSSAVPCVLFPLFSSLTFLNLVRGIVSGLFLLAIAPIAIVWLISKAWGISIDIPDRKARLTLFPLAIVCQSLAVIAFTQLGITRMVAFSSLCLLVTVSIFLLNLKLKASIHAAALAGSVTALVSTFGTPVLPAYLLLIPVVWSRRKLRVHVFRDLLIGTFVGLLIGFVVYYHFDLALVFRS